MKILVVEDDESMARLCREELEDERYEVIVALTGFKGLQLFRDENPDLVTLDIKLPDLDGMELLRQMKSLRPEVPVIILTAYDYMHDFLVCDADGYLVKSPDFTELKNKIRRVLEDIKPRENAGGSEEQTGRWATATFMIREEYLTELKALSLRENRSMEETLDDALSAYLKKG